jgi:hypothetical protein
MFFVRKSEQPLFNFDNSVEVKSHCPAVCSYTIPPAVLCMYVISMAPLTYIYVAHLTSLCAHSQP